MPRFDRKVSALLSLPTARAGRSLGLSLGLFTGLFATRARQQQEHP
jgi:hypothetical protein